MESLNLNTLANSLPAQANAEKELLNDFKAAALSITTLYRSSRKNAKRAYNAGYATACQDLLNFMQHNVSVEGANGANPSGMVSRVMDWTEARLEAIKATEEDEEEEEERENASKGGAAKPAAGNAVKKTSNAVASMSNLPTPHSPNPTSSPALPPHPSSPSPPPASSLRPHYHRDQRLTKLRTTGNGAGSGLPLLSTQSSSIPSSIIPTSTLSPTSVSFNDEPTTPSPLDPIVIGAGAKRRHAMMMMDSPTTGTFNSAPSPASPASTEGGASTRRRTRGARSLGASTVHNHGGQQTDSMDVEEEGRERKRVARR